MHQYCHKVQYYETDQMQIAHHSNYIRWFEEARTFFLEKMGFGYEKMEKEGVTCPVTEVGCRYIKMVRFPDEVYIDTRICSFSGVRMTIEYVITNSKTHEVSAKGFSKHCFLGVSGKPVALQKEKPELFELLKRSVEER
ncbi:MAG: acyl-CoA thioesterase [Clostridiales bacterium]|nr:acyl-CoA thioesterase [Clostridiales bacterium]